MCTSELHEVRSIKVSAHLTSIAQIRIFLVMNAFDPNLPPNFWQSNRRSVISDQWRRIPMLPIRESNQITVQKINEIHDGDGWFSCGVASCVSLEKTIHHFVRELVGQRFPFRANWQRSLLFL